MSVVLATISVEYGGNWDRVDCRLEISKRRRTRCLLTQLPQSIKHIIKV